MENNITMGSLFDGSAGFPLASLINGIQPVWASEVEPFPIRVTTKRLPFMKHYGDISKINGAEIEPVDIITGGSPCQDMSVAGKRKGLDGERSVLFREQIRIIKEMREKTNGKYPRFMVWENVPGALSSNKGQDFRCVLEETANIKSPTFNVPMPKDNKWGTAGLIVDEDNNFSIGWRVLDAQYWGVPQRRRRIFLVADFSGTSAGEILFKREGLSWNFTQSRETWQTATGSIATGTDKTSEPTIYSIDREAMNAGYEFDRAPGIDESGTAYTLKATGPGGVAHPEKYLFENHSQDTRYKGPLEVAQIVVEEQVPMTLQVRCGCEGGDKGALIQENKSATLSTVNNQTLFCMATQQGGAEIAENLSPTITAAAGMSGNNQPVVCVDQGGGKTQCNVTENLSPTLTCTHGGEPVVATAYSLQGNMIGRSDKNGPQGMGVNENVNFTLNATDVHAILASGKKTVGTLMANAGTKLWPGNQEAFSGDYTIIESNYIVRRLTPLECARLQGFPDWWCSNLGTENPTEEDLVFWRDVFEVHRQVISGATKPKTDKQIIKWLKDPHNDGAEYKMWGNGVALPNVLFVLEGVTAILKGGDAT